MRVYRFVRWLLSRGTLVFFRRIEIVGSRHVPKPGQAALFCGNHPNSLLDPILITSHCDRVLHFAAKDVLFKGPLLRFVLSAMGAVPVKRRMDHDGTPIDNEAVFQALHDVLAAGHCVGIFPEGLSHREPKLAPFKTGAARIALGAKRAHPDTPITIIPTGLCYFTRDRFRSSVLIQFGDPIEVTAEQARDGASPERVRELTDQLEQRLRGLTVNADSWERIRVLDAVRRLYRPDGVSLENQAELARRFNEEYPRFADEKAVKQAYDRVRAYQLRISAVGLRDDVFARELSIKETAWGVAGHALLLFASLPLCLLGAPVHAPLGLLFKTSRFLAPRNDVIATTKFLVGFLVLLVVYAGISVGAGLSLGVGWGLLAALVLPASGAAFLHVLNRVNALRHIFLTSFRILRLPREVAALRDERLELEVLINYLVAKYYGDGAGDAAGEEEQ